MKRKKRIQWYSVILLAFSLTACQVKRPETVIPDAKMENVLYDFHIAKAMGEEVCDRIFYLTAKTITRTVA